MFYCYLSSARRSSIRQQVVQNRIQVNVKVDVMDVTTDKCENA